MLQKVEKQIAAVQKRLSHNVYKTKEYFDLSKADRKRLINDFNALISLLHDLNKKHKRLKKWWKDSEKEFERGFTFFWLAQYLVNMYVKALSSNRVIDTFLNDPYQGKQGVLADFRKNNIWIQRGFIFLYAIRRAEKNSFCRMLMINYPLSVSAEVINIRKFLKYYLLELWLPIQYFFARFPVRRYWFWKKSTLIKGEHLDDLEPYLQAGDILLHRTNFFISNPTLLGFWTHTMLYDGKGYIIESTPYKVRKIAWKKAAIVDYICVLRPKCSPWQKKKAVKYAESQIGKLYDFNFDFLSDRALVCSELILKSYPFLKPTLESKIGRLVYPSTNFIMLFNERKLDFVYFLDSRLYSNKVILGTPKELAESNLRSRWDLLQK